MSTSTRARASSSHMRRTSSLEDVRAFVSHFPDHLSWRAERESFAHEATQYALWIPFAALARACGMRTLSYLFCTWFVLGELMLVYTHEAHRKVLRALRCGTCRRPSRARRRRREDRRRGRRSGGFSWITCFGERLRWRVCFRWCRNRSGGTCRIWCIRWGSFRGKRRAAAETAEEEEMKTR